MTVLTSIKAYLTKLPDSAIYIGIIGCLTAGLIYEVSKKPQVEIKTVTQTIKQIQYVDRVVHDNIQTKVVTRVAKDGSKVITKTISNTSKIVVTDSIKTSDTVKTTDTKIYQKDYLLNVTYGVTNSNINTFSPSNVQMSIGKRLFGLPLFGTIGTNGKFNSISVGITLEL